MLPSKSAHFQRELTMTDQLLFKKTRLALLLAIFLCSAAYSEVTVTIAPTPPSGPVISGGEQITVEFFMTSGTEMRIKGAEAGMFCSITNGTTTLTIVPNGVATHETSADGVEPICAGQRSYILQAGCYAGRTPNTAPGPPGSPCPMHINQMYYIASFTYQVSDCAIDAIEIHAEPLGVADGIPSGSDETRIRDDCPCLGLVPIVAENFSTFFSQPQAFYGACCLASVCLADKIAQSCCGVLFPGSTFLQGAYCPSSLHADIYPFTGDGNIDIDDLTCVLLEFVEPGQCANADIAPCGGNGFVDIDDLLALLDAFAGFFHCPHSCP